MSKQSSPKYIYFVLAKESNKIKIGISHDPLRRVRALKTGTWSDLEFLGCLPGVEEDEKNIHKQWQHLHVKGEWFELSQDMLDWIEKNAMIKLFPQISKKTDDSKRPVSSKASRVLEELAKRHKTSLSLPADRGWLEQITPYPLKLLQNMVRNKVLYRLGHGRYVIAPPGTTMPLQAASSEQIIDILLSPYGKYYIGFLNGMINFRLTDLHSTTSYAGIPYTRSSRPIKIVAEQKLHEIGRAHV